MIPVFRLLQPVAGALPSRYDRALSRDGRIALTFVSTGQVIRVDALGLSGDASLQLGGTHRSDKV